MSESTTKLTVADLCSLNAELNSEKGLMSERLPMVFKYHLSKLATIAAEEQEAVNKLRDEAIKAVGKKTPQGGFVIDQFIEEKGEKGEKLKKQNPLYTKFVADMNALFAQERTVVHEDLFLSDLKNVESEGVFPVLFRLLKN